ncbi:MAG: 1-phosphofructokinase family hexose kinase [Thermoleophilia bacterium]|nr:1-phosphofructokinase family hexose kinase [Thermoleophilia bacterium]NLE10559.1 1-phosphofructokinase family hexose kinase [Actinomycetota bacterium]
MLLTVTLNPALDRTMTVPNFQAGFRHRATDTVMLPGGKGINVARAAKTLGRPVIATGFIAGRKGDQIVADLNDEGIMCDFVRVKGESRISTAVVDSATNAVTEINEQGPEIRSDDLGLLHEKLDYLGKAADAVVFAGSVPPGLGDDCYAELIQHVRRLGLTSLFYTYADPLRLGIKAGPDYVFPKLVEVEKVIGYEFTGLEDRINAAKTIREMGAGSVVITYRYGCIAVLADGAGSRTFVGKIPPVDVVSSLGWADTFTGGFAVRLLEGDKPADCLRFGLGCGAANLISYGAGLFSPADAERLAGLVELEEVSAEG